MSKLLIYRASAGSGKTYRLAAEYITQLIRTPESYSRILAVTFTNKATNEMKERILRELLTLTKGEESSIGNEIAETLSISKDELRFKAKRALSLILHDYSNFSISTIDSFVQRVLQSLLWEIGLQGKFDIELDSNYALSLAADNLLDGASENKRVLEWLTEMVKSRLDDGSHWDIRKALVELGKEIFSETFRLMDSEDIEKITNKQEAYSFKEKLDKYSKNIADEISSKGKEFLKEIEAHGLGVESFVHGKSGLIGFVLKCSNLNSKDEILPEGGQRLQDALNDPSGVSWVKKEVSKNKTAFAPIETLIVTNLFAKLNELYNSVIEKGAHYATAKLISQNLNNLGLIGDLWHEVKELSKTEGFILISDSHQLLREFVKETDAPFVFEKMGNRYDHFLIDEFQDTSIVQWHNFKPLIANGLAQGNFSMVVGDVKQSIYRWRNGDWQILAEGLQRDFKDYSIDERFLSTNYRSQPLIVNFNNIFFEKALELSTDRIVEETIDINPELANKLKRMLNNAYKDIKQIPKEKNSNLGGCVEVRIAETNSAADYNLVLSKQLPELIVSLQTKYSYSNIAILIRNKKEGTAIAEMLMEHNKKQPTNSSKIDFISQEGLLLKSSATVRLIIAAIRIIQNSNNEIAQRELIKELTTVEYLPITNWHNQFSVETVHRETQWLSQLELLPLQEIFENIVARYNLTSCSGELAYIADIHEQILSFPAKKGADINRFLEWWDEKSDGLSLNIPETNNAISILTIHKSKGLQFPVVIIPNANWDFKPKGATSLVWVSVPIEPFNGLPRYPVSLKTNAKFSLLANEFMENRMQELVDNLNLLYVAFTRPENELYIFSKYADTKSTETKPLSNTGVVIKSILNTTYNELGASCSNEFIEGVNVDTYLIKKEQVGNAIAHSDLQREHWITTSYPTNRTMPKIRTNRDSRDFFGEATTTTKAIEYGKLMHLVFSNIKTATEVDTTIVNMVREGFINSESKNELSAKLHKILSNEPMAKWFSENYKVVNEATILTPDGSSYRPDRVMINDEETLVVDFKFGAPSPSHSKQILRYVYLLIEMGYKNVKGFLWYVDIDKLVVV